MQAHERDRPPLTGVAQAQVVGQAHTVEEHLVEVRGAVGLAQRADLDPGELHVAHEEREAAVLGDVGIGARHEDRPARAAGAAGPHLLAVHHPLVAVAHRHRREAGEVGTGTRLAEELAPGLLTGEDRRQETRLLLVGADRVDRGRRLVHADEVAGAGCGCAEGPDAVLHHLLPRRRDTESTEPGLEVHPSEPGVVPGQERVAVRGRGIGEPREQVVERSDDPLLPSSSARVAAPWPTPIQLTCSEDIGVPRPGVGPTEAAPERGDAATLSRAEREAR